MRGSACGPRAPANHPDSVTPVSTLAERLGYAPDAKLVIISCDDLGSSHAANIGVYAALREGAASCASLMVPAPWAHHAAAMYRGDDLGVHLTLNAEHPLYQWGPITHAPSLLSGGGGFPASIDDLWEHADAEEVRRECRAQIERAIVWGVDVTHLAPHLSAITLCAQLRQTRPLLLLDERVHAQRLVVLMLVDRELVHADDGADAAVDLLGDLVGGSFDLGLLEALLDRSNRAAHVGDALDERECLSLDLVGHRLDDI